MEKLNSKTFGSVLASQTKSTQELKYSRIINSLDEKMITASMHGDECIIIGDHDDYPQESREFYHELEFQYKYGNLVADYRDRGINVEQETRHNSYGGEIHSYEFRWVN